MAFPAAWRAIWAFTLSPTLGLLGRALGLALLDGADRFGGRTADDPAASTIATRSTVCCSLLALAFRDAGPPRATSGSRTACRWGAPANLGRGRITSRSVFHHLLSHLHGERGHPSPFGGLCSPFVALYPAVGLRIRARNLRPRNCVDTGRQRSPPPDFQLRVWAGMLAGFKRLCSPPGRSGSIRIWATIVLMARVSIRDHRRWRRQPDRHLVRRAVDRHGRGADHGRLSVGQRGGGSMGS